MEGCREKECKYFTEIYDKQNDIWEYYPYCKLLKMFIPEEEICNEYTKAQKCYNCKYKKEIVYETGTIDCIDYHCRLQNNKFIYSDIHFMIDAYAEFPDCQIDKWESK